MHIVPLEDIDAGSAAKALCSGQVVIAMAYALDVKDARETCSRVDFIFPEEGALLWTDTWVIPRASRNKLAAETFMNFALRPEVSAQLVEGSAFATPNDAALPLISPDLLNDPMIFPPRKALERAEIILPLTPDGERRYQDLWERLMAGSR